jgi:hypothetical protein
MNAKQKCLLIAAGDLLAGLSDGTLDRAIRHTDGRKGGGYSSTVCVKCDRIAALHDAVEALWPGLVARAHELHLKRYQEGQKAREELAAKERARIKEHNRPLIEAQEKHRLEQYRKMIGYPPDWPKCPGCGLPAMDGHITCGRVECDEGGRR